jgi:hypothetical protein
MSPAEQSLQPTGAALSACGRIRAVRAAPAAELIVHGQRDGLVAKFLVVALEGDLLTRLDGLVRACGKEPIGEARLFTDWASVSPFVNQNGYLGAARSGNWTVLVDDGSVTGPIFDDVDLGSRLADEFATRVVSAYGSSVSGFCGFRVHIPGGGLRSVLVDQNGLVADEGEPIPGEEPVDPDTFNEYSVLDTLELLGLDIADGVESASRCALLQFTIEPGAPADGGRGAGSS